MTKLEARIPNEARIPRDGLWGRGPLQTVAGLAKCEDALGRERVLALLQAAGVTDGGAVDVFERIYQLRRRRPWR